MKIIEQHFKTIHNQMTLHFKIYEVIKAILNDLHIFGRTASSTGPASKCTVVMFMGKYSLQCMSEPLHLRFNM